MRQHGFTLVEILVALLIFAILSVIVSAGLHAVLNSDRGVVAQQKTLKALLKTKVTLSDDIAQLVAKTEKDMQGQSIPPIQSISDGLTFIRIKNSGYERVRYVVANHQLIRQVGQRRVVLLTGVSDWSVRYLDRQNSFYTTWPLAYGSNAERMNASPLPKAIEIRFKLQREGGWYALLPVL